MKNIYFISDVHLDLNRDKDTEDRKENLIAFLESIEKKASKIVFFLSVVAPPLKCIA